MSDFGDALEGAIALVFGGFIFLLFAGVYPAGSPLNPSWMGMVFIVFGLLLAIVAVSVAISKVVTSSL